MEEEKIPQLTLEPDFETVEEPVIKEPDFLQKQEAAPNAGPDLSALSPAEQKAVLDFAEKIDLTDSAQVMEYGAAAQKKIADFSDTALANVQTKDMG